jgi:hypothetical protein
VTLTILSEGIIPLFDEKKNLLRNFGLSIASAHNEMITDDSGSRHKPCHAAPRVAHIDPPPIHYHSEKRQLTHTSQLWGSSPRRTCAHIPTLVHRTELLLAQAQWSTRGG